MSHSRREFLKKSGSLALFSSIPGFAMSGKEPMDKKPEPNKLKQNPNWPIEEGPHTPKLCMNASMNPDEEEIRKLKQLGIRHVIVPGMKPIPWKEKDLRRIINRFERYKMKVIDTMFGGIDKAIYGAKGRDKQIENVKKSIRAAGEVGIPVMEYNWYAHRAVEGYHQIVGRGGAGVLAFDYDRVKKLPLLEGDKYMSADDLWNHYTYFLKEVIPVADEAGVRLAVHPNDPPPSKTRGGTAQILTTFDDFKRLVNIVDSPSNGMTGHPGYYNELGIDGLKVLRYLGHRDRINHMHYRNTIMFEPHKKYHEVFPDNGQVDMFTAMRQIIRLGYTRGIYAEHPRVLDYDVNNGNTDGFKGDGGYTGFAYNTAYARAMMQAALMVEGKV
jgi:mannonate dehydratase